MVAVKDDQDQFHGMEEQVCCRIIQHLRGTQPAYLPTTDEKSESEDQAPAQPRRKHSIAMFYLTYVYLCGVYPLPPPLPPPHPCCVTMSAAQITHELSGARHKDYFNVYSFRLEWHSHLSMLCCVIIMCTCSFMFLCHLYVLLILP